MCCKNISHIANNYGIVVSFVNPAYTLKRCLVCGCIDSENRECQEEFKYIDCGFESNADFNAVINIKDIATNAVLSGKLLKANKIGNGGLVHKSLERDKVKKILLSCKTTTSTAKNR